MSPPGCNSKVPSHWALAFTDALAEYMVALFQQHTLPEADKSGCPIELPNVHLETLCETDRMVGRIIFAYQNPGLWSFLSY